MQMLERALSDEDREVRIVAVKTLGTKNARAAVRAAIQNHLAVDGEIIRGGKQTGMACDPQIPIGRIGAVFACFATLDDGATQTVEYTMDRAGSLSARLISSTETTRRRIPASTDPWDN